AQGDLELQIDAGKVNTAGGWRDVKVGVFARRGRGAPAPAVRSVVAAVEEAAAFGQRCAAGAERVRLTHPGQLGGLGGGGAGGGGGEWVGKVAGRQFAGARGLLDIYHGAGYIAGGAKAVFGEGSASAEAHGARGRLRLLEDGYWGVTEWIGEITGAMPAGGDG